MAEIVNYPMKREPRLVPMMAVWCEFTSPAGLDETSVVADISVPYPAKVSLPFPPALNAAEFIFPALIALNDEVV
jgi:hypothetical protein